jgi:hypothetical protein
MMIIDNPNRVTMMIIDAHIDRAPAIAKWKRWNNITTADI